MYICIDLFVCSSKTYVLFCSLCVQCLWYETKHGFYVKQCVGSTPEQTDRETDTDWTVCKPM